MAAGEPRLGALAAPTLANQHHNPQEEDTMKNIFAHRILLLALALTCVSTPWVYADQQPKTVLLERAAADSQGGDAMRFGDERFARTELYFGTARTDGSPPVTEQQFQTFLDKHITPAFPDGLTLLKGLGQFRGADGVTIEEDSFLVILLYPVEARQESNQKIEQIRRDYKGEFGQESVLRSDFCCERVGF